MSPLTAEVLIGQLLMADFSGFSPSPEITRLITEQHLGGVLLFQKNIESPAQVARLCRDLQDLARQAGSPPLLIAVDQEGGPVERLPLGLPGAMALGATRSAAFAEEAGRITGRALRAVGCNVDFAPVLDVNSNPANPIIGVRSFGEEPGLVAQLGSAFAAGLQREGVAATGKHFPGHGDADLDSHLDLPVVAHGMERLEAVEFLPFRHAIREGLGALMTAHIAFTAFGSIPATLSPPVLEGMLRRAWGFDGVVFTDSFAMAPIKEHVGAGPAAVLALLAGADVLLALGGSDLQREVFASVRRAAEQGVLSVQRLRQSFERVQRLRPRMTPPGPPAEAEAVVASAELRQRAAEIAGHAVTLVRNEAGMIPLPDGPADVLSLVPQARIPEDAAGQPTLSAMLRTLQRPARDVLLSAGDSWDGATGGGVVIVVPHSQGRPSPWQVDLVRRAHEAHGDRLVVVATGTPYDLADLPPVSTYVATYGREPGLLMAAARMLLGAAPPRGRLPVTIPGRYPVGHGIVW